MRTIAGIVVAAALLAGCRTPSAGERCGEAKRVLGAGNGMCVGVAADGPYVMARDSAGFHLEGSGAEVIVYQFDDVEEVQRVRGVAFAASAIPAGKYLVVVGKTARPGELQALRDFVKGW